MLRVDLSNPLICRAFTVLDGIFRVRRPSVRARVRIDVRVLLFSPLPLSLSLFLERGIPDFHDVVFSFRNRGYVENVECSRELRERREKCGSIRRSLVFDSRRSGERRK